MSGQLVTRFDHLKESATGGRLQIWVETLPIIHDFALGGTGLGTYRMTMLVYQRTDREILFNQAHDEYLQLAAEGGLLVGIPLLLAAVVLIAGIARRLRDDTSSGFWIRAGATASLAGIMTQSIWETGLRMPANGLLFAIVCAIAVHGPQAASARPEHPAAESRNGRGGKRTGGRRDEEARALAEERLVRTAVVVRIEPCVRGESARAITSSRKPQPAGDTGRPQQHIGSERLGQTGVDGARAERGRLNRPDDIRDRARKARGSGARARAARAGTGSARAGDGQPSAAAARRAAAGVSGSGGWRIAGTWAVNLRTRARAPCGRADG